ncbi:MAG: 1,2-phenylacetyl-CoA epoxidase subunit PaaD [Lautropia sp.]|nr:1,2-phenylacetyl-CoA epoxidase subunit PaaD [Lautropia sp.]
MNAVDTYSLPDLDQVWRWLDQVPDPEIPVISLVDLGIIRELHYDAGTLVVTVTPTYSGCPATTIINRDIESALRRHGIVDLRLERRLSPPWTTEWLSEKGRARLREYGIAPPDDSTAKVPAETVTAIPGQRTIWLRQRALVSTKTPTVSCPRCGSNHTECVSQFGSTPCKASYRCLRCLEPFDYFKCI